MHPVSSPVAPRTVVLLVAAALVAASLMACGARSTLDDPSSPAGGSGGAAPTTTSSTSSSGGSTPGCEALAVVDPIVPIAPPAGVARAPELGRLEGEILLTMIESIPGLPGVLWATRLDPFDHWPPLVVEQAPVMPDIDEQVVGSGAQAPTALLRTGAGELLLALALWPSLVDVMPAFTGGFEPLFVTAILDRWLWAAATPTSDYGVLELSSFQTGSLAQAEDPLVCITSRVLAAATPSGQGFVGAHVEPNPPEPSCDAQNPRPGTIVSVARYDAPVEPGTFLSRTQGERVVAPEPSVHLALSPRGEGAWVVFQTDGSTSEVMPAIAALPVDSGGHATPPGAPPIAVSPEGVGTPHIAVAPLGDAMALGWIDSLDPSAPTIVIQILRADGQLGPATSIPTNDLWLAGRIRLVASADARSLLVAWEGGLAETQVALARVDCLATR